VWACVPADADGETTLLEVSTGEVGHVALGELSYVIGEFQKDSGARARRWRLQSDLDAPYVRACGHDRRPRRASGNASDRRPRASGQVEGSRRKPSNFSQMGRSCL
jgi:hypothetical protein